MSPYSAWKVELNGKPLNIPHWLGVGFNASATKPADMERMQRGIRAVSAHH